MCRLIAAIAIALFATTTFAKEYPPAPAPYRSLTQQFSQFADQTIAIPKAQRVAMFRRKFNALFPGFYEPSNGQTQKQLDQTVADALDNFAALRPTYERTVRAFPRAYAQGIAHFRKHFPGFKPNVPVWLVHSLGQMDGGTRTLHGRVHLVFGADVIARIHNDDTLGPFLDHELFHVENGRWFKDCGSGTTVWCGLWQEGSATYAASVMNPGASDRMLLLDGTKPIRGVVDAQWHQAVCKLSADLEKKDETTFASYFYGNDLPGAITPRWGYYMGYRLMQRLGKRFSLSELAHFGNARAHALVAVEIAKMVKEVGGCAAEQAVAA